MKRIFDLVISAGLLVIFAPLIAVIAVMVRWRLGKPIIFKQQRPGLCGKPFYLYKFRTMTDQKDERGELLPDHLRLTRFGRFLRKYSMDELVQLINVIKGDLSLVGPRPLLMDYLSLYTKEECRRHDVLPGITGWAQVNGRNAISWEDKFKLDIWYVDHRSLWLDFRILWLTVLKVVRSEGISEKNHATMRVFEGSEGKHEQRSSQHIVH